ncbi:MAG: hypothetical protein AB7O37_19805 [Vicinamibacteria bacterium]
MDLPSLLLAAAVAFPGPATVAVSPDGKHEIVWITAVLEGDPQRLMLRETGSGEARPLFSFPRRVEVLWSPRGDHLAVTSEGLRDRKAVLVWDSLETPPADLEEALREALRPDDELAASPRLTIAALRWDGPARLRVRVTGDVVGKKLARELVYTIGSGFGSR